MQHYSHDLDPADLRVLRQVLRVAEHQDRVPLRIDADDRRLPLASLVASGEDRRVVEKAVARADRLVLALAGVDRGRGVVGPFLGVTEKDRQKGKKEKKQERKTDRKPARECETCMGT